MEEKNLKKDFFGPKLRKILKENLITNKQLAKALEMDEQTISNCFTYNINSEYKKTSLPFWANTVKLINYLQIKIPNFDINYLFKKEDIYNIELEIQKTIEQQAETKQKINYIKSENERLKVVNEQLREKNNKLKERIKNIENYFKLPRNLNLFVIKSIVNYLEQYNLSSIFYSLLLDEKFLILLDSLNKYVIYNSLQDLYKGKSPEYLNELQILFNELISCQVEKYTNLMELYKCEKDSFHIIACNHYKLRYLEEEFIQNLPTKIFELAEIPKEFLSENLNITDL